MEDSEDFRFHNENEPIMMLKDCCAWYIDDKLVKSYDELQQLTNKSDMEITMLKLKYGLMVGFKE